MMKKLVVMTILAVFTAGAAMAQNDSVPADGKKKGGFGSFVKRVGEQTTGINMTDEPFVVNPLKSAIEVEFVGAYGDASTGVVSLVFKVKNKTNATFVLCGGNTYQTAAFDVKGKTYKTNLSVGPNFDAPKGIWAEIAMVGKSKGAFVDVPETLAAFELIKMYCQVDGNNKGLIEFRNIPIQWGVVPE